MPEPRNEPVWMEHCEKHQIEYAWHEACPACIEAYYDGVYDYEKENG